LEKAELAESEIWYRQDYRQAFICVSLASRGDAQPFVESSYRIYGKHPDRVWPHILALRKAKLGREFPDCYNASGNLKPDIPKKTSAPVTPHPDEQVPVRLAAVLMFPKPTVSIEDVEQASSLRRPKKSNRNLYEMPAPSRSEKRQPLRILPALSVRCNARASPSARVLSVIAWLTSVELRRIREMQYSCSSIPN